MVDVNEIDEAIQENLAMIHKLTDIIESLIRLRHSLIKNEEKDDED